MVQEMRVLLRNLDVPHMDQAKVSLENGGYEGLKKALAMKGEEIIDLLKESGLRGRGGAGFPTWRKIQFAYDAEGDRKVVVCNADEGEPGTNKDRILLKADPHSVFEGMAIIAKAIGADRGYIYLRIEYRYLFDMLENALESARQENLLGDHILGTDFSFDIEIRFGAGAYICGEETALFESIEGKRGEPRVRPPYPGTFGLFGLPTVLNNVETLANIGQILAKGPAWFRGIGSEGSCGTKLFTVIGNVKRRGVFELPMGTNLRDIIYDLCEGIEADRDLIGVQTGGASGPIIRHDQIDLPLDIDHVADSGGRLGCGTIFVIDDSNCIVDIVKNNLEFFAHESCGQCIPCREGGKQLLNLVTKIAHGQGTSQDLDTIRDLCDTMSTTSLCGLGSSTAIPALSSILNFREAYNHHIDKEPCPKCMPQGAGKGE